MVFTAPYAFYVGLMPLEGGGEMCNETWDGIKKTAYGAFTNVMQFVLPFVTIIFCYTAIIKKLEQRSAQRPGAPRLVYSHCVHLCLIVLYCILPHPEPFFQSYFKGLSSNGGGILPPVIS